MSNELPKAPKGLDPLTHCLNERLIHFCQLIKPKALSDYGSAGMRVNYIVVDFNQQDGAQEEYEDFVHQTDMEIKAKEALSIESVYASNWKKASARLGKFALIIHTHAQLQGANATPCDFGYECDEYQRSFSNANTRIDQPISLVTTKKAINLEMEMRKQRIEVADLCRTAPTKREDALIDGLKHTRMESVLQKVKDQGPITTARLKSLLNGRLKLTRAMIGDILNTLIERGCLSTTKQGRTELLGWFKGIR